MLQHVQPTRILRSTIYQVTSVSNILSDPLSQFTLRHIPALSPHRFRSFFITIKMNKDIIVMCPLRIMEVHNTLQIVVLVSAHRVLIGYYSHPCRAKNLGGLIDHAHGLFMLVQTPGRRTLSAGTLTAVARGHHDFHSVTPRLRLVQGLEE